MPKASPETSSVVQEVAGATSRSHDLGGGWTVNFETTRAQLDTRRLGVKDCQTPHLGYVLAGRITYRTDEGDEVFEAGEAYYVPPGHTTLVDAGTRYVEFSPTALHGPAYRRAVASWNRLAASGELSQVVACP